MQAGRYQEAIDTVKPILTKDPKSVGAVRVTTDAERRSGRRDDAIKTLEAALVGQDVSESLELVFALAETYEEMGNYDKAISTYEDALGVLVNPDGTHASFYDNAAQRRNLTNYCAPTSSSYYVASRNSWGVDLNRNNEIGSIFDGYAGASSSCSSDTFSGPSEVSEPEIKNEHWVVDTFPKIKFAMNLHTHGGYFMWAPGAYKAAGRVTLPAPNIGIERYFFEVADDVLSHIRTTRDTTILPQRTGPIADVLYSAAGNSADDMYYRKGIIGYSFEAGAQRITVNQTTGAITRAAVGFQPCFGPVGTGGGTGTCNASLVNEGHDEAMEFAEGNLGLIKGALDYANDTTTPKTTIQFSSAQTSGDPIDYKFDWLGEGAIIFYTTDGSNPVIVPDDPATPLVDERCENTTTTKCYNGQGPRMPGQVLTLGTPGAYTVKWISQDVKGNIEPLQSQRLLVAADDADGGATGNVPATLSLSLGAAASFGPFTPGVPKDYTASTTANVISTAGNALLTVSDAGPNPGQLQNGTFFLPQKLQASASSMGGTAAAGGAVGGPSAPTSLLTYSGPVSNDSVMVSFKQSIGATDALRTGTYGKPLTFTLSTTQP